MNYQTNINTNANCALFNNCWKKINVKEKFENPGFKAAHSAEIINNKMYVFGGWNGKKALSDLHIFDFNKLEWTEPEVSGSKPGLRNNHATCVYNEYMYLHGGHNGEIWQDDLYILDSNRLIWNKIDSNLTVPSARACHTLNRIGKKIYMIGGYDGLICYSDVDIFDLENKEWINKNKFTVKGKQPEARNAHTVTTINSKLYMYGGHSGNRHLKDMYILETTTLVWNQVNFTGESPLEGLRGHSSTYLGCHIYIFGGYDGKGRSNDLYIYDIQNNSFALNKYNEKCPTVRQRHTAVAYDNHKLVVFGGFDGGKWLNDIYILNASNLIENIMIEKFNSDFNDQINTLKKDDFLSDVEFVLNNNYTIKAIKCILAVRSNFFKNVFLKLNEINNNLLINSEYSNSNYYNYIVIKLNNNINSNVCNNNLENKNELDSSNLSEIEIENTNNNVCSEEINNKIIDNSNNCIVYEVNNILIYYYKYNNFELKTNLHKTNDIEGSKNDNNDNNNSNILKVIFKVNREIFECLIEYIYSANISDIDVNLAIQLLPISKILDLDLLFKYCEIIMRNNFSKENIVNVLIASYSNNLKSLKEYLLNYIKKNYAEFSNNYMFNLLESYPNILMDIMIISLEL